MFCGNCGTSLVGNENVCPSCGARIKTEQTPINSAPADNNPQPNNPIFNDPGSLAPKNNNNGSDTKKAIIIAIAVVVVIMAILGVVLYQISPYGRYSAKIRLGQKYLDQGEYESAVLTLQEAIEILPKKSKAYIVLGMTYETRDDYRSAIDLIYDAWEIVDERNRDELEDYRNELWDRANEFYFGGNGDSTLEGLVTIADYDTDYSNNEFLPNATVQLYIMHVGIPGIETTTDAEGVYKFNNLLEGLYEVSVSKDGYLPSSMAVDVNSSDTTVYAGMIELIPEEFAGDGSASGRIVDALTGNGVSDISMEFRKGNDNLSGEIVGETVTESNGNYTSPTLSAGNYCVVMKDASTDRKAKNETYVETYINVKVLGETNIPNQDGTVTTQILDGQLRIVLSWGQNPEDLDSHLICPAGTTVENEAHMWDDGYYTNQPEIFYANKETYTPSGEALAFLDLDDTDSYGPETTTIYTSQGGVFSFYVFDYTSYVYDEESQLQYSGAYVRVYKGNNNVPSASFPVPRGAGEYWSVFKYDSEQDEIIPINRIGSSIFY